MFQNSLISEKGEYDFAHFHLLLHLKWLFFNFADTIIYGKCGVE